MQAVHTFCRYLARVMQGVAACGVLSLAVAPAQTITLAEGSATSLNIISVPESNPNAPDTVILQDVELLPIEITGRVLGQEMDVDRSRRLDRNDIVRVELPDGGRLLRYRRSGGAHWGFLHIATTGAAQVVLEQPGIGLADPFEDRIGVARNGSHMCVPLLAGGLFLVRLDGNTYASTGTTHRLVAAGKIVEPHSVMVGDQVVWFQSQMLEVFRCGLGDGAVPTSVSPPPQANAILKDQMAMSGDGSRIVFLYGPQTLQQLWTAGLVGPAALLSPPPSKYEDPGYLPEEPGSPALMLNEDGSRLFFVDSIVRDELFLLDTTGALPTFQITADAVFQPYIGVHILPGFLADAVTVAIGDANQMDWFRATLASGGGSVVNLTATGSALQPFPAGTLDPSTAAKNGNVQYAVEQGPAALRLRRIDLATGAQIVLHDNLAGVPQRGASFGNGADLVVATLDGDLLYPSNGTLPLYALPPGLHLMPPARGPMYSAVFVELAGASVGVSGVFLPNGAFVIGSLEATPAQLCVTQSNGAIIVGAAVRYLAPGSAVVLTRPTVAWRRCLAGAGV